MRHKWFVFVECCKLGIPWLGIIHDWSKFLPREFSPYARYFYGNYPKRADIKGDMRNIISDRYTAEGVKVAFDVAWLHHQKGNRHHWQYWLLQYDNENTYTVQSPGDGYGLMLCQNQQRLLWFTAADYKDDVLDSEAWRRLNPIIELLNKKPVAMPMPDRYCREMLADWRGAGRAYGNPDTREWYLAHKDDIILHPDTRERVERELGV